MANHSTRLSAKARPLAATKFFTMRPSRRATTTLNHVRRTRNMECRMMSNASLVRKVGKMILKMALSWRRNSLLTPTFWTFSTGLKNCLCWRIVSGVVWANKAFGGFWSDCWLNGISTRSNAWFLEWRWWSLLVFGFRLVMSNVAANDKAAAPTTWAFFCARRDATDSCKGFEKVCMLVRSRNKRIDRPKQSHGDKSVENFKVR